ncbi:hypothetical protein XELAEV_18035050mg [Xenopus laevis]|uniref:Uncharacterized protein n=1 Tax=Xenopus laevis TaxID=8355 RepID=A0A974HBQ5_XENLA|nr:hypothetical protein XELAEV_18035050mg [Xenopus laevis]
MAHIWWHCPLVKMYWLRVFGIIDSITKIHIRKDPWVALFNQRIPNSNGISRKLIMFIFTAAKQLIAKSRQLIMTPFLSIPKLKAHKMVIMINKELTSLIGNS